jgi:hypothetical protein
MKIPDTIQVLEAARLLIEKSWSQGVAWRDSNGNPCDEADAVSYCLIGAIHKAANSLSLDVASEISARVWANSAVHPYIGGLSIPVWNDMPGRTKEEVLSVIDQGIQRLERFYGEYSPSPERSEKVD